MDHAEEQSKTELWLVMILDEVLSLAFPNREPLHAFRTGQRVFHAVGASAIGAFYDRLTDPHGRMVGIRVAPVADHPDSMKQVLARVSGRPYLVRSFDGSWIDVYLGGVIDRRAESQGDQAFGGRIYVSEDEQMAISLDLEYLAASEEDIQAVRAASARLVEILLPSDRPA